MRISISPDMKNEPNIPSTTIAIHCDQLRKTYEKGAVIAVDNVSFDVKRGELFGLIGPDGAGKTSIFRVLTTLLLADSGTASVDGFDVVRDYKAIRQRVGYMPGKFSLYQDLSVEENLNFFATIFNTSLKENYDLIKDIYIQIEPFKTRRAGALSGGMKQKLALCCALIHKPSVLFLDEPTTGVDAVSRKEFWEMLKKLKEQNISILVSTPYMDEATLCDRIALIQEGKILSIDTPENITKSYPGKLFAIKGKSTYQLMQGLRQMEAIALSYAFGEYIHFTFKEDSTGNTMDLRKHLQDANIDVTEIKEIEPTIEDEFIRLSLGGEQLTVNN